MVQDKLGMPDLLVFVGVTGIKVRTLTCASLSVGEKPNGSGPCLIRSPWQQLLHEGGHSDNRSVFLGGIVHLVPTKSKESSKERNTLRLTSPVDSSNNELRLVCEKEEQYTNCKGQEMEVSALTQGMGSKPLDQLCSNQPGDWLPMRSASSRPGRSGRAERELSACRVSRARTSHSEDATMAGDGRS